jgi:hypothetical protein
MAAADRLISRKKPLAAGMLSELNKGAVTAEQISHKFGQLGQYAFRYVCKCTTKLGVLLQPPQ